MANSNPKPKPKKPRAGPRSPKPQIAADDEALATLLALAKGTRDKHLARWLVVFKTRIVLQRQKPKGSWPTTYRVASKHLANTFARGTPRTMRSSYAAIQQKRRRVLKIWF